MLVAHTTHLCCARLAHTTFRRLRQPRNSRRPGATPQYPPRPSVCLPAHTMAHSRQPLPPSPCNSGILCASVPCSLKCESAPRCTEPAHGHPSLAVSKHARNICMNWQRPRPNAPRKHSKTVENGGKPWKSQCFAARPPFPRVKPPFTSAMPPLGPARPPFTSARPPNP